MNDTTNENKNEDIEHTIEQVSKRLHVDIDWAREITVEELRYLFDHCPFLQIVNPEPTIDEQYDEVRIITAEASNWEIHDYGDAMSSSPGKFLIGGGNFRIYSDEDGGDQGGGGPINPGKGTLVAQAFNTAAEMIAIAKERGWKAVQIIDGHPIMERAAWMKADASGLEVRGFAPSEKDINLRNRIEMSAEDLESLRHDIKRADQEQEPKP